MASFRARLLSEATGTLLLVVAVVGSGIMAERLTAPPHVSPVLALLANTVATGGALVALILTFARTSGAHFNPCVTLSEASRGNLPWIDAVLVAIAQICAAIAGTFLCHAEFGLRILGNTGAPRLTQGTFIGEVIATAGLILVVRKVGPLGPLPSAAAVAGWIVGGYWFTSSTAFANPAVTIARSFTSTYTGIHSSDVMGFIGAQVIGCLIAMALDRATRESTS